MDDKLIGSSMLYVKLQITEDTSRCHKNSEGTKIQKYLKTEN